MRNAECRIKLRNNWKYYDKIDIFCVYLFVMKGAK